MAKSYAATLKYLYDRLPMFSKVGDSAIKKDLTNTLKLCESLGNPEKKFRSVHIAGTNGKGSTSNMLAAILQEAGYKTGLYTSPHLLDFRERIRINGEMIPQQEVVGFVDTHQALIESIQPSFFEVTVAMAFQYFAEQQVDIAIIETGLGGRLDSTNIIHPILSIITNISLDHVHILGNTLGEIAGEKAGIIKESVPVVISEKSEATSPVFTKKALETNSKIIFASEDWEIDIIEKDNEKLVLQSNRIPGNDLEEYNPPINRPFKLDLPGTYQVRNLKGVFAAIDQLCGQGYMINKQHVIDALEHVKEITGLRARWQTLSTKPLIICDTGHNEAGWREVLSNLQQTSYENLHMVIGVMRDKDAGKLFEVLPQHASYYFCNADFERALPAEDLARQSVSHNLRGQPYPSVLSAVKAAMKNAKENDLVFIGGSTFIVAEALALFS